MILPGTNFLIALKGESLFVKRPGAEFSFNLDFTEFWEGCPEVVMRWASRKVILPNWLRPDDILTSDYARAFLSWDCENHCLDQVLYDSLRI